MSKIIIAIPRGRIINECKHILDKTSFAPEQSLYEEDNRKLTFNSKDENINYIKINIFPDGGISRFRIFGKKI